MQRRNFLKTIAGGGGTSIAAPYLNFSQIQLFADSPESYSARCVDMVHRSLVIDMLSQFKLGAFPDVIPDKNKPTAPWWSHPETFTAADLARYKESSINVFHIGWGTGQLPPYEDPKKALSPWDGFITHFSHNFLRVGRVD